MYRASWPCSLGLFHTLIKCWAGGLGFVLSVKFLLGSGSCFSARLSHLPLLTCRARPVITVDVSIFLPVSINITAPQCHDGQQPVNCLNVTACFSFHGRHVPGEIGNEPRSRGSGEPSWLEWVCGVEGSPGVFLGSCLLCISAGVAGSRPIGPVSFPPAYEGQTVTSLGRGRGRPVGLVEM